MNRWSEKNSQHNETLLYEVRGKWAIEKRPCNCRGLNSFLLRSIFYQHSTIGDVVMLQQIYFYAQYLFGFLFHHELNTNKIITPRLTKVYISTEKKNTKNTKATRDRNSNRKPIPKFIFHFLFTINIILHEIRAKLAILCHFLS